MKLIECEYEPNIKELHVTYVLGKGDTVDDIVARFRMRFNAEPTVGYRWENFVYVVRAE